MSWPSPKMCLGMMGRNDVDMASSKAGWGADRRIVAVCGSSIVTAVIFLNGFEGKLQVFRSDRLAVVERGLFVQLEAQAATVFRELPFFGQIGVRFPVGIDAQRHGEQLRGRRHGGDTRLHR